MILSFLPLEYQSSRFIEEDLFFEGLVRGFNCMLHFVVQFEVQFYRRGRASGRGKNTSMPHTKAIQQQQQQQQQRMN